MIKMIYKYDNYDYDDIGHQPYDIKTELTVINDATATEVVETLVELMKIAGYQEQGIIRALNEVAGNETESFEDTFIRLVNENEVNKK